MDDVYINEDGTVTVVVSENAYAKASIAYIHTRLIAIAAVYGNSSAVALIEKIMGMGYKQAQDLMSDIWDKRDEVLLPESTIGHIGIEEEPPKKQITIARNTFNEARHWLRRGNFMKACEMVKELESCSLRQAVSIVDVLKFTSHLKTKKI